MCVKEIINNIDIIFSKDNKGNIWYNNKCTPNIYNLDENDIQIQEKIFSVISYENRMIIIKKYELNFQYLSPRQLNLLCLLYKNPMKLSNYVNNTMNNNMNSEEKISSKHFFFD